jgi:hypothetical protein
MAGALARAGSDGGAIPPAEDLSLETDLPRNSGGAVTSMEMKNR